MTGCYGNRSSTTLLKNIRKKSANVSRLEYDKFLQDIVQCTSLKPVNSRQFVGEADTLYSFFFSIRSHQVAQDVNLMIAKSTVSCHVNSISQTEFVDKCTAITTSDATLKSFKSQIKNGKTLHQNTLVESTNIAKNKNALLPCFRPARKRIQTDAMDTFAKYIMQTFLRSSIYVTTKEPRASINQGFCGCLIRTISQEPKIANGLIFRIVITKISLFYEKHAYIIDKIAETTQFLATAPITDTIIIVTLETFTLGYDIFRAHRQKARGHMDTSDYAHTLINLSASMVLRTCGMILGAHVGAVIIPIPVVGSIIGSLGGALLGSGICYLVRKLIGKIKKLRFWKS